MPTGTLPNDPSARLFTKAKINLTVRRKAGGCCEGRIVAGVATEGRGRPHLDSPANLRPSA